MHLIPREAGPEGIGGRGRFFTSRTSAGSWGLSGCPSSHPNPAHTRVTSAVSAGEEPWAKEGVSEGLGGSHVWRKRVGGAMRAHVVATPLVYVTGTRGCCHMRPTFKAQEVPYDLSYAFYLSDAHQFKLTIVVCRTYSLSYQVLDFL